MTSLETPVGVSLTRTLKAKEIERWISSDEITVKEEADVLKIILDWVNFRKNERKAAFEELFSHVRLYFFRVTVWRMS